jgi:hypothetical protein
MRLSNPFMSGAVALAFSTNEIKESTKEFKGWLHW